jgi:hypothetical protein
MALSPTVCRRLAAALLGAAVALPAAAQAGSSTAESIWDRNNALQRAMQQLPAGATVTRQQCQDIGIRMDNIRYRCTVWWSTTPPPATSPEPGP